MKTKIKKFLAMLMVIITLFLAIQPTVLAANEVISGEGESDFIARQYATRIKTTDPSNGTDLRNYC